MCLEVRGATPPSQDKASLEAAQELLKSVIADVKAVAGVKSVQRVVCGGCLDFKVGQSWCVWKQPRFDLLLNLNMVSI